MPAKSESSLEQQQLPVPSDASVDPKLASTKQAFFHVPSSAAPDTTSTPPTIIAVGKESQVHTSRNFLMVGRQVSSCDIRVNHKSLSRQHAVVYYRINSEEKEQLYVQDLGTKSGTFVSSQRLTAHQPFSLEHGDVLQWGKALPAFTVQWENEMNAENATRLVETKEASSPLSHHNNDTSLSDDNDKEPVQELLTGRAKRQAEIAAMMASLDAPIDYVKPAEVVQTTINDETTTTDPSHNSARTKKEQKIQQRLSKYKLPLTDSSPLCKMEASTISAMVLDPAGSRFAIAKMDSTIHLYDLSSLNWNNPSPFRTLAVQEGYPVRSIAYAPTGSRFLVATGSIQPKLFDRDGQEIIQFVRGDVYVTDPRKTLGHTAAVTAVAWHSTERSMVFTTSQDGSLRVWNVDKGKLSFKMLTCHEVVIVKNMTSGKKTVPTCLASCPGLLIMGTSCGSVQLYPYPFTSKLRPQQYTVVSETEPVVNLTVSAENNRLAVRTTTAIAVYDLSSRLSRSTSPLLHLTDLSALRDTDRSIPTVSFSPNAKTLAVATTTTLEVSQGPLKNCIDVYTVPSTTTSKAAKRIYQHVLDSGEEVVGLAWHPKLNQMLVSTSRDFQVLYSPQFSEKGVLLSLGRRRKRAQMEDDLQQLYAKRAPPPGTAIREEEILAPNALPLFGGRTHHKRSKFDEDPQKATMPDQPSKDIFNTNSSVFATMVMEEQTGDHITIAGQDPREALAKYSEGKSYISSAYVGNKERIVYEKTIEEELEEQKKK